MTAFYLSVATLLILSFGFLALACFSKLPQTNDAFVVQRIKRNIGLYRERLQQFQADFDDGLLEQDDFEQLQAELGRDLIASVNKLEGMESEATSNHKSLLWLVVVLLLPLLSFGFYQSLGAYKDWQIAEQIQSLKLVDNQQVFLAQSSELSKAILSRLEDKPEHIDYRVLLASFAMGRQDYSMASVHYGVLAELLPDDATAQAYYAQALYLKNGRKVDADVAQAMDKTLVLDPRNRTVLGLQGISAYENGDFVAAIEAWKSLLVVIDASSQQGQLISAGIAEAKSHLTKHQLQALEANEVQAGEGISVIVSAVDEIKRLDKELFVFVYAKASSGPKLPLAVKRIQLKDLPVEVFLNDDLSMTPEFTLTKFEEVVVGARVSLSGQPVAQSGDWFIQSETIQWRKKKSLALLIDQQVP